MKRLKSLSNEWAGFGFLLVLWAAYYYRVLFLGQTVVLLDSSRFFYPLWKWGAGVWGQGLIPLWNPDAGFGTPYLADPQMAAWYPPRFFFYSLFSPTTAFNLLIVGHHLWALLGFWVFARNRGYSPWVSLAGSMIFGFSFNAASLAWITSILFTFSWIPWVFLALDRLREEKAGFFVLLLSALAMQMAAGYPLLAYLTGLALGLEWLLLVFFEKEKRGWRRPLKQIGWALLAATGALAYNSAWLLPLKEMIGYSNLDRRMEMWQSGDWSSLATWFNPFFDGHPLFSHPDNPFNYTVYFAGLPTLVVLIWGIVKRKASKVSLTFFLLLLLLSLGETAFVGGWLKEILPGYSLVVRSGYWMPLVLFACAILFMVSVQAINEDKTKANGSFKNEIGWSLLSGIVFCLALWLGVPWDLWSLWVSFLFVVVAGFSSRVPLVWRKAFLAFSLLFSLGPVVRGVNFTMDSAYYETDPKILESLSKTGRIHHSISTIDRYRTISGNSVSDAYEKLKQVLVPNWPLAEAKEEVYEENTIFLMSTLRWDIAAETAARRGNGSLKDYLNIRYSVDEAMGKGWKEITSPGSPVKLWENEKVLPKWFSTGMAIPEEMKGDWNKFFYLPAFDFKQKSFIADATRKGSYSSRSVKEVVRTPNKLVLEADGDGRALLVSSETAYPGWKARVGGDWRFLEEVNHGFRGLILENGEESATLVYQPLLFRLGCFLSLLVCGFWMGLLLNLRRKL